MSVIVIAFPLQRCPAPAPGPVRFTDSERQAILALGYVPGLMASFDRDEDDDEWAIVTEDTDAVDPPGVEIIKVGGGFKLGDGQGVIGAFSSIGQTVAAARATMAERRVVVEEVVPPGLRLAGGRGFEPR